MWDVRACRGCLAVNCKLVKLSNACKRIFGAVTGLEIKDTDGFPKYFCTECLTQIKKSVAFRRKARRAHFVLQEIATVRKEVAYKDIAAVDRVRTNLKSNLDYWKTTNREIYNIQSPELENVTNEEEGSNKYMKPKTYEPKFNRVSTCQVIDIKPDGVYCKNDIEEKTLQEIQDNLEKPLTAEEVILKNDIDNNSESGIPEQLETRNIDINDVFKDLKEDSLSETEELQEKPVTYKKRNRKKRDAQVLGNPWIGLLSLNQHQQCVKALVNSKIEFQTVLQQSNNFAIRMMREPYFSASFKCFICLLVFKNVDTLTLHANLHNKWSKGSYKCNICKNKFLDSEQLVMHLATNHWYKYTCNLCNITEYTLSDIMKHHSVHEEKKEEVYSSFMSVDALREYFNLKLLSQDELHKTGEMYTGACLIDNCYDCNIRNKSFNNMEKYGIKTYNTHYQCDVCSQWFKNTKSIEEHVQNWHTYLFECKTCSTVLYNRSQAHHHYMSHQPKKKPKIIPIKKKKDFSCLECNKTLASNKSLRCHMWKVHGKGQWSDHCNLCGKPFWKSCRLYLHQLQVHKYISLNHSIIGSEQFLCKKCEIYFVNEKAYQYHLLVMDHEEAKDLPLACVICKKLFENNEEFSKHTLTCKTFPKKCSYCEEMLMNVSEYKLHYFRQHPDLQYKHLEGSLCELCGKTVHTKTLKAHVQKHFAGNTFQCRYCSMVCSTATHLFIHIVSMHTYTPYLCGFCWKRHKNRKSCLDHILRIHAPVKPFKCKFCNKHYSDMKLFDQHSIMNHGIKVNTKPITQVKKIKGKLYLYPNMKIDVSLVDESLFQNVEAELCDYLDEKSKPIQNIDNYIVSNQEVDSNSAFNSKIKKRKVTDRTVSTTKKMKIEDENESVRNKKVYFKNNYERKEVNDEKLEFEFEDSYIDTYGQMEVLLEENTPQDMQVDEKELEIIVKNGNEFIILNGTMYKIEDSEVR